MGALKKIVISILMVFLFNQISAQLDFTVEKGLNPDRKWKNGEIKVEVTDGAGPYTFILMTDEPWDGGKIIKEYKNINAKTYLFEKLKLKEYVVVVREKDNTALMVSVDLSELQN